ncbi:MAG: Type II secretion system protein E [Chlamydiae bacterium]|nr:Type II secretion system protein E [Chlamydiota bacterium]
MKKITNKIVEALYQQGKLSKTQYEQIGIWQNGTITKEERMLLSKMITQEDLKEAYAFLYDMPVLKSLPPINQIGSHFQKLGYKFLKTHQCVPLFEKQGKLQVLTCDPKNIAALDEIGFVFACSVEPIFCQQHLFEELMQKLFSKKEEDVYKDFEKQDQKKEVLPDLLDTSYEVPVVNLLNRILQEAIEQKASDIHFEPSEQGLQLRFRIDGVLQTKPMPPVDIQDQLLTRLKVMARLDIAQHRLPQDGRIRLVMGGRDIDLRVSLIPVADGQRIVLRILDKSKTLLNLKELKMPDSIEISFRKAIEKSEGIILVTGPTGSGKSTSLYSALAKINQTSINIMTIEDPIEYRLDGISQMATNPKIQLNFSTGLRSLLRQDPDVIMIGEIRDTETAKIAIQASLTGHLVFSTLHTNDASSAIVRLAEMGVETYLLSSSIIGVLSQRLVRTICKECKVAYTPDEKELKDLNLEREELQNGMLFKGKGCGACFGCGYLGRRAIFEWVEMTPNIKKQIHISLNADALKQTAKTDGMHFLKEHGAYLVKTGITTIYEVMRVVG